MKKIRKVKYIKIHPDKCTGCLACEMICSSSHADKPYSISNPKRSRIRVFFDESNDVYVPVLAGKYTDVECVGRMTTEVKGKEYGECSFCRQSCPSRDLFRMPDTQEPVQCDMCECLDPIPDEPMCVKWCYADALTYEEKEEEIEVTEEEEEKEVEVLQ